MWLNYSHNQQPPIALILCEFWACCWHKMSSDSSFFHSNYSLIIEVRFMDVYFRLENLNKYQEF